MLTITDTFPEALLYTSPKELDCMFDSPTLIHIPGRQKQPLLVTVLSHGNEDTGFYAVQALLRKYVGKELPRAMSLFISNIEAAKLGERRLAGQPDYNRIWPGSEVPPTPEHKMMQQVFDEMRNHSVFASIDIHNNTGLNPHYACINVLEHRFLHLASLFSRTVVYFIRPKGVQSMAFAEICPAVTVECGKVGHKYGAEHALEFIEACLHLHEIPDHPLPPQDVDLYHTVATIKIHEDVDFGFGDATCELLFNKNIDHFNFRELPIDTTFAWLHSEGTHHLEVLDEQGNDTTNDFFYYSEGELLTRKPVVPSMLTTDSRIIRQDCFGYLMERIPPDNIRSKSGG